METLKNVLLGIVLVLASPVIVLYLVGKDFREKRQREKGLKRV